MVILSRLIFDNVQMNPKDNCKNGREKEDNEMIQEIARNLNRLFLFNGKNNGVDSFVFISNDSYRINEKI